MRELSNAPTRKYRRNNILNFQLKMRSEKEEKLFSNRMSIKSAFGFYHVRTLYVLRLHKESTRN